MDKPSRFRAVLNCILCALGFSLTAGAIHRFAPAQNTPEVKNKLMYFARHKDEFDAVFVGTSRTYSGVKPTVFDNVLQQKGMHMRSFNLAVIGLWGPEEFWMVRRVLAQKPKSLKWLFIEVTPIWYPPGTDSGVRNLAWRGWKETVFILRSEWQEALDSKAEHLRIRIPKTLKRSTQRRWRRLIGKIPSPVLVWVRFIETAAPHVAQFVRNQTNIGLAVTVEPPPVMDASLDAAAIEREAGYGFPWENRRMTAEEAGKYSEQLAELQRKSPPAPDVRTQRAYADLAAEVRRSGVTPICFIAPLGRPDHFYVTLPAGEDAFVFNRPQQYPELYDPTYRKDLDHLNGLGAEKFSRLLAERFAASLGN